MNKLLSRLRQTLQMFRTLFARSRDARWAIASQVLTSGANFATTIILVRAIGLEGFGQFSVCFLLMMVIRNFLGGMVLTPMSTIGPKLKPASIAAYRGFLALNAATFAAGSSLLLVALAVPLGMLLNAEWLTDVALATAAANLTGNLADFLRRYHFVYEAPVRAFLVDSGRFGVQLACLAFLGAAGELSATSALYAIALGGLVGAAVGALRVGIIRLKSKLLRAAWPRHWNFIKWMTPNVALEAIQSSGIYFIGAAILGPTAVGIARAMQSYSNVLNIPFLGLQSVLVSMAARERSRRGDKAMFRLLALAASLTIPPTILLGLLAASTSGLATSVFGIDPQQGFPVLVLYLVVNVLFLVRLPLTTALSVEEAVQPLFISMLASAGAGLAVVAWSALPLGAVSLPAATVTATVVACVVQAIAILCFGHSRECSVSTR